MLMKNVVLTFCLSFTFFAQAQNSPSDFQIATSQIKEADAIAKAWMSKRALGLKTRDLYESQPERANYIISGIPKHAKLVSIKDRVFRHYVGNNIDIILNTRQLKSGHMPYVVISPGYGREVYEDLVGMFLTNPNTPPEKVGLSHDKRADYIEFTLYDGTPVVELEPEILLIPGKQDFPDWIKKAYADYKKTGKGPTYYMDSFNKIDAQGGPNPTYMKLKILRFRYEGKITEL